MITPQMLELRNTINNVDQCDEIFDYTLIKLKELLSASHIVLLEQLVKFGPVEDGDVISKSDRNDLIELNLVVRVCCKGQQGYTAATYHAYTLLRIGNKS